MVHNSDGDGLIVEYDGRRRRGPLDAEDLRRALRGAAPWRPLVLRGWADLPDPPPSGPWAPVVHAVDLLLVGPAFSATSGDPCLACLRARATAHDDLGALLAARADARQAGCAGYDAGDAARLADWAAGALRRLAELPPGAMLMRGADGEALPAGVLPRGGCADCGAPPLSAPAPPDARAPLRAGGYRPLPAETFLARTAPSTIDPVTGIVRSLAAPNRPCVFAHAVLARHAFPLARPSPAATIRNRRGRSAGKGRTRADAEAGALAEALERYAGVHRPGDAPVLARVQELDAPAIDPLAWSLHSKAQMAEATAWRALDAPAAWTPDPFDRDAPILWSPVTDAVSGARGWAPAALCWHQAPEPPGAAVPGRADSNGCAAGQTRTDAMLQGLLELVERDAVGIWWWTRARRPELDPRAFDDPWLTGALAEIARRGYEVSLRDLTHDLAVPVIAAVAWPRRGRGPLLLGFGAHPAPRIAAARATTELAQALPAEAPEEIGGDPREGFGLVPGETLGRATLEEDLGFLRPSGRAEAAIDAPRPPADADAALAALLAALARRGVRVWTLDQTRPDVPVPVMRMIAPGMRHFRPRFAPGRLESVPAALGWRLDPAGRNRLFIPQ